MSLWSPSQGWRDCRTCLHPGRAAGFGGISWHPQKWYSPLPRRMGPGGWCVRSFPIVAAANYHRLHGLKQREFIILQFWRSDVLSYSEWTKKKPTSQKEKKNEGKRLKQLERRKQRRQSNTRVIATSIIESPKNETEKKRVTGNILNISKVNEKLNLQIEKTNHTYQ